MANESLPGLRGEIRAQVEATYGTAPATPIAATEAKYVENWEAEAKPIMEPRTGMAPYRAGWRPRVVGQENNWSAEVEITAFTVPAAGSNPPVLAERPEIDVWLAACGFGEAAYADAASNTDIYTLLSHGHRSVTIEERFFNPALTDGVGRVFTGCRADWTLTIDGAGVWRLAMDGSAKGGTAITTPAAVTLTYGFEGGAVVGSQTTATLVSLDGNGDSTFAGQVVSATITGNMNKTVNPGLHGTIGPATVTLNPEQGVGVELLIEQQVDSEWDPFAWMLDQDGSSNAYSLKLSATVGGNSVIIGESVAGASTFFIAGTDLSIVSNEGGRRLWRVSHSGLYPEVAADGGGLVPANNFTILYKTPD